MVRSSSENNTKDWILVSNGVLVSLQDYGSNTISSAIAICFIVKRFARTSLAEEMSAAQTRENVGIRKHVGTSSESGIAFTRSERGNGNVESSKAGRACSINREAGSAPLEEVVETARA